MTSTTQRQETRTATMPINVEMMLKNLRDRNPSIKIVCWAESADRDTVYQVPVSTRMLVYSMEYRKITNTLILEVEG